MEDDDRPRRAPVRLAVLPLDELGLEELADYAAGLRAELARVDAAANAKRTRRSEADAVFGRRGQDDA